ncbi:hypothetical protein [Haloferula sp. BvORR071]|uniref:hypothetical protein n=1 Tax=Haloferula sp. BvORR071 TaxID=1396141 RepID=UPI00054CD6FC|nr:hypothetical protein [Haloferula sp. BvORR071]
MKGTVESMGGRYKLPEGMADPCEVVIVAWPPGSQDIEVEDTQDRRWTVAHWLVDCGFEFYVGGRWVAESDPRILKRLEASLNRRAAGYSEEFRRRAEMILKRYGR